jgi:hypothetical protein
MTVGGIHSAHCTKAMTVTGKSPTAIVDLIRRFEIHHNKVSQVVVYLTTSLLVDYLNSTERIRSLFSNI